MTTTNPDLYLHAFSTFMGMPPDTTVKPVCGATLTEAYDRQPKGRPHCPTCDRIYQEWQAQSKGATA